MKRVYLALPTAEAEAVAIRKRLRRKKLAKHVELVDELESAQVVVTSTNDIGTLPERLPGSVELLQLIDCGGGQRYRDVPGLTISNASNLMHSDVGDAALSLVIGASQEIQEATGRRSLEIGFVGLGGVFQGFFSAIFGNKEISLWLSEFSWVSLAINDILSLPRAFEIDLRNRLAEVGIILWRQSLEQILSNNDFVIVAVHHGPTADPLIGAEEAELLRPRSWVIDVSEEGVVDPSAFDPIEIRGPLPTYIQIDEVTTSQWVDSVGVDLGATPKSLAKFIGWTLRRFDISYPIHEVEHIDF